VRHWEEEEEEALFAYCCCYCFHYHHHLGSDYGLERLVVTLAKTSLRCVLGTREGRLMLEEVCLVERVGEVGQRRLDCLLLCRKRSLARGLGYEGHLKKMMMMSGGMGLNLVIVELG
jgi:hypothetical protein